MTGSRRERWAQVVLVLILFICYAYFLPRRVDWNQNGRMDLVLAIVDQGSLAIDDYRGNTGDYAHFGDHYYCDKAPGTSFLGVPFYWAFRTLTRLPAIGPALQQTAAAAAPGPASLQEQAGLFPWRGYYALALYATTLGAVALPSALLGVLVYRLARQLGASAGDAALLTMVYGLGTTAFPYGSAFYGHMVAACCLFGAFYLIYHARGGDRHFRSARHLVRLLGAGFLLGWAVITEYPMALPAGVLGLYAIYAVRDWRRLLCLAAGGVIPLMLLAAYDMAIYGTPWPAGYQYSELWQEQVHTGFMTLTFPTLERLWGITFSPYRGLFALSPALLCVFPGLYELWRRPGWRAEWLTFIGVIVSLFLFNASSVVWWGGYAVGPRYVSPAVPFLALPIAAWLGRAGRGKWVFVVTGALSILSVWAQTMAGLKYYPPEQYHYPLVDYALPLLARGEIALNLGTALGLRGPASLLPLALGLLVLGGILVGLCWPSREEALCVAR